MPGKLGAILLVDDERSERETMGSALRAAGFTVYEGKDYDSGLVTFAAHPFEITLAVLDVSLPGKNGIELGKALLQQNGELRVLFVSGHVGAEVVRFYGIAATDLHFLRKPFAPELLLERINLILSSNAPVPTVIAQSGAY